MPLLILDELEKKNLVPTEKAERIRNAYWYKRRKHLGWIEAPEEKKDIRPTLKIK